MSGADFKRRLDAANTPPPVSLEAERVKRAGERLLMPDDDHQGTPIETHFAPADAAMMRDFLDYMRGKPQAPRGVSGKLLYNATYLQDDRLLRYPPPAGATPPTSLIWYISGYGLGSIDKEQLGKSGLVKDPNLDYLLYLCEDEQLRIAGRNVTDNTVRNLTALPVDLTALPVDAAVILGAFRGPEAPDPSVAPPDPAAPKSLEAVLTWHASRPPSN